MLIEIPVASNSEPNAKRPAQPLRGKKSADKPIRITDLIPRRDVKGGTRTVFGAPGLPEKSDRKNDPSK